MKLKILLLLFTIFKLSSFLSAQSITINQPVPNITISPLTGYKSQTAKISDFKGKLLVLDFWATWCSPCVAIMPKMDSLQTKYVDKVQFLPVAYQSKENVETFLAKLEKQNHRKERLPLLMGDTVLGKLFPHTTLPHLVWIGPDGIVKAITDQDALNSAFIERLLAGQTPNIKMKTDEIISYDHDSPLLISSPQGICFAVTKYRAGIGSGYYNNTMIAGNGDYRRITARNLTVPGLFRLAFSKQKKETILEVANPSDLEIDNLHGDSYLDWLKQDHAYCMELILPDSIRTNAYTILRNKLNGYFTNYQASLEKRRIKCLTLIRTSNVDKLKSAGEKPAVDQDAFGAKFSNCYLRVFISRMQVPLQFNPLPLLDETGYLGKVDLELSGDLTKIDELNRALAKYDLRFEEKVADIEMLIIKDKK